jgi:hypothetical protein
MALTKFDIASAALVMIGAQPVASFGDDGSVLAEQVACHHLYQPTVDHWLSLYPWRFASRQTQMSRAPANAEDPNKPVGWQAVYTVPRDMKALQGIRLNSDGRDILFDRFENRVYCNASETDAVYAVHTYEPPIAWWPGYFVQLIEAGLAHKLSFAITGKLDLALDLGKTVEGTFRLAKNADSRQQTTRRFKVSGPRSILSARRG